MTLGEYDEKRYDIVSTTDIFVINRIGVKLLSKSMIAMSETLDLSVEVNIWYILPQLSFSHLQSKSVPATLIVIPCDSWCPESSWRRWD